MLIAPSPLDEVQRLEALHAYHAFHAGPEPGFDRITSLVSRTLGVPTAYVSLLGEDTQHLISCFNLDGLRETSREIAFCAHAILGDDVLVVPDATLDRRFWDSPLVTDRPHIRFYAGCPLRSPTGYNIGTLCAIDTEPRCPTPAMLSTLRDLSALVIDQLELRKWVVEEESRHRHDAETNYRRLAEAIHGMVFRIKQTSATEFEYLYLSQGSLDLLGLPPEFLIEHKTTFVKCVHPDDLDSFQRSGQITWQLGVPWSWVGRLITTVGTKWVRGEGRCERLPDGSAILEGLVYDISESKHREAALREAKETAERANLAKSEFLSRMSHELRTPMNAILGFAQMLEMEPMEAEAQEDLAQVKKAGEHLLGLINEVLDLSSLDAQRISMSIEPVRIEEVLTETCGLLRPLFESLGIRLRPLPAMDELFVLADRQRFKQIVINLMTNAAKYNRTGGSVSVRAFFEEDRIALEITDEGAGISSEMIERLFTPFDRLGAAGSGIEGTGLGLTISRGLAELMGGRLSVRSVVGEGSTFTLRLPLASCPLSLLPPIPEEHRLILPESTTKEVLYIEDNESNILLVQRILRQRPETRLTTAKSIVAGLERLVESMPQALLLDLNLPDGSGEAVIHWIRNESSCPHLPIIVLSADATPRQAERILAAGADSYLTKPLNLPSFLSVFDKALQEGQA